MRPSWSGRHSRMWRLTALLLALGLVFAACGGDDDSADTTAAGGDGGGDGGETTLNVAIVGNPRWRTSPA